MRGGVSFSLADALFLAVPDFTEAHFDEAPRLDNVDVKPNYKGDKDLPAQWRALKRLAIQGHDHERELFFFKGELQSRRWSVDKPWHAVFWFGLFYQGLSDFGRSMVRPILLWFASIAGFGWFYLAQSPVLAGKSIGSFLVSLKWLPMVGNGGWPTLSCVAGTDQPLWAAILLSLHKATLFLGVGASDKLNQMYACLYDVQGGAVGPLPQRFVPLIPDGIAFASLFQGFVSAVLIFLFLLALRNHFRIK